MNIHNKMQNAYEGATVALGGLTFAELSGWLDIMTQVGQVVIGVLTSIMLSLTIYNKILEIREKKRASNPDQSA